VKKELETVLMLDPKFQLGSADRALGRWYLKVPRLFGGSKDKSVEHLQKSLTYDPNSTASHYFLAETYLEMDRDDDARREAQKVIDLPINPLWAPEDREFKRQAKDLLQKLR
jgi:tetratricopeptide (TPR) repeat protein